MNVGGNALTRLMVIDVIVVDATSTCNIIINRPIFNSIETTISTYTLEMHFSMSEGFMKNS